MTVIGITGGIGSGKSAVGKMLTEMGCEVIDSDSYTRSVLKRGQPAYADIVAYFGNGILGGDGERSTAENSRLSFLPTRTSWNA